MSNIDPKLFARLEGEYASLKDKYASLEDQYEHAMASRMSLIREKRELQEHISLSPASHGAELQARISELETKNSEQRANYEAEISELRANLDAANSEVEAVADEFTRRKSVFQATVERVGQDLERCHGTLFDGMDDFWKSFPTFKRGTLSRIDSSADSQTYGLPSNDNDLALGRLSLHDQQPSASSAAFEETDLTAPEDSGRIASSPTISSRSDEVARRLRDYQGYPRSPSLEQDSESAPASVTPFAKKSVERTEALASPGLQQPLAASSRSPWHLGTGQFRETGWTTAAHGLQRSPGLRPWEEPGMFGQSTLKMEDASFAALNPPKITPGPANTDSRYAQINPMGQFATPGPPQQQMSSTSALPSTQRLPAEAMPPGSSTVKKAQGQPARSAGASSAVGPSSKTKADPIKALRESNKPRFSTSQSPSMSSAKAAAAQQAPRKALVPKGQEGPQSTIKPGPATNRVPDPRSITPTRTSPMNYAGAVAKSPSASSTDSEALLTMTPAEIQAAADRDRVRKGLPPARSTRSKMLNEVMDDKHGQKAEQAPVDDADSAPLPSVVRSVIESDHTAPQSGTPRSQQQPSDGGVRGLDGPRPDVSQAHAGEKELGSGKMSSWAEADDAEMDDRRMLEMMDEYGHTYDPTIKAPPIPVEARMAFVVQIEPEKSRREQILEKPSWRTQT